MIIVKCNKWNDIDIYFPEYNWTAKNKIYSAFEKGQIKCPYERSVYGKGYLGEGEYLCSINRIATKVYKVWFEMLKRCYCSQYQEKQPTYKGCKVCDEWLNFQNFAKWYQENYYDVPGEVMNLDKDILVKGNKIYSPETCVVVPKRINNLFTKTNARRGNYPIGVCWKENNKKFESNCNIYENGRKKKIHIGLYNTPEEAFDSYKEFKERYIKQIADEYKEQIPSELYKALYEYEVEIDD